MSKKVLFVVVLVAGVGYLWAQAPVAPATPTPAAPVPAEAAPAPALPAPEGAAPVATPDGEVPALPEIPDEELFIGKVVKEGDNFYFQEEEGSRWELEKNDFVDQIGKTAMGKPLEVFGKVKDKEGKKFIEITSFEIIEEEDALFAPETEEGETKTEAPALEAPKTEAPKAEAPKAEGK